MFNNEETFNNGNSIRKDKDKKQRFRDPIKVVVEAIRISRARRYPNRLTFYEFLHLFGALAPEVLEGNHDEKVACQMVLDKKGLKGYKIGKTKVHLRTGQIVELDARRAEAAREIGALKEAKEKLQKHLEELTWNLQLEKRLRIDLEEAKAQEISRLQDDLHAVQSQLEEANSRVIKEQEIARRAIEEARQVIEKTPVLIQDTKKVDSAIVEVESLKDFNFAASNPLEPDTKEKPQKSLNEKQDFLVKKISQDLGFSEGRPIAACVIYKCLLHWRLFTVEKTSMFDSIIQRFGSAIEDQDDNGILSCWLSHSSTLLWLLLQTLKAIGNTSLTQPSFLQGFRASPRRVGYSFLSFRMLNGLEDFQSEAKLPALLFKQQLTAFLEKVYGMIRDNLKKEISPLLGLCIQFPRISRKSLVEASRSQANFSTQGYLVAHWRSIVKILNNYLSTLRDNCVPPFLVHEMFTQIFWFINVQLFNSLLLRRECCSFKHGEYVKTGLAELEQWCIDCIQYARSSWEELKHIRQAVEFLITHNKPKKSFNGIVKGLCSVLSMQQIYRISSIYMDDTYGTLSVSANVLSILRTWMTEYSDPDDVNAFLLDDDSRIPFSVDDISKSMQPIEIDDINPPPLICENSLLVLLLRHA